MTKKITISIVMAVLCLNFGAIAQTLTKITGRVANLEGKPLPGATLKIKQSGAITTTNNNGEFVLNVTEPAGTLLISFTGYKNKSLNYQVTNQSQLQIILDENTNSLDEVQIMGYGQTTRRTNTGNISTVKAADLERQPVTNPLAALQGRVPGLSITQTSGVAGSAFKVLIRGQSALDAGLSQNDPLFIIDGIPFEPGNTISGRLNSAANNSADEGGLSPLNTINPQDIESIDVLKDADATAIYGSRGANGVILITTKQGKNGKTSFNVNTYTGFSQVGRTMSMLNTSQYLTLRKEAFKNDGIIPTAVNAPDILLWDTTRYTDFKKLLIGNTAHDYQLQLSVNGGNEHTNFRLGGNYHKQTTVFAKNFADEVSAVSLSINHRTPDNRFSIQLSTQYARDHNKLPGKDFSRYLNLPPNLRLYDDQGNLSWEESGVVYNTLGNGDIINPLALLEEKFNSNNSNLVTNLVLNYKILEGLSFKTNLGYNQFNTKETLIKPTKAIDPNLITNYGVMPAASFSSSLLQNWIIEPQADYKRAGRFGTLNLMAGLTFQSKNSQSDYQYGNNYSSDLLLNNIAAAGLLTVGNDEATYRYNAVFGRINYNYDEKYIVNITGRRDGSSRFGPGKQMATFGAVGIAWLFTNEKPIKAQLPFLSSGKLRASYGTTGNDQIGEYKFLNLWANTTATYNGAAGLYPRSLYNPNYNWEMIKKAEAALELGLFKDRILFSAAYYNNRCSNQLINYTLPSQTGFFQVVKNFPGLVQNAGLEFTLNTINIDRNGFRWTTAFNLSANRNKLISFPGLSASSYKSRYIEGEPLSLIQALRYLGVNPQTGVYTFEDFNNDGRLTSADYQLFGSRDPKFNGGFQNNFSIAGLELTFFVQFTRQLGLNYVNQLSSSTPGKIYNQPVVVLNRWQNEGDVTDIQKLTSATNSTAGALSNLRQSNGLYTDASFIKLRNVSLSYQFPQQWLSRYPISGCKIYAQAQNVLTLTHYKGADPETQNFYTLPPLKTFVFGLQLNL
ncbi:SusC/RagA family TonB-linked outer membrane protein [Pedobacter chinensis]|uniref:SusC/RagA family TonB-linked outer membrane protein n=1 Tax=Pedobacter chinensis TaxID=2282421 RepID=A0A369PNG3_9SPHI|nr:SusC/RagA family TonB-linked outer membrane protein [Pedobacter chinensis]RDC54141.1 SusC/RagA family TonB-linked outer membrane protein [Pedobacter chinensis]